MEIVKHNPENHMITAFPRALVPQLKVKGGPNLETNRNTAGNTSLSTFEGQTVKHTQFDHDHQGKRTNI